MESILAKSVKDQYEIGSRVATLLAGTSLTTTAGVDIKRRDPVEEIGYETVGKFLSLFELRSLVINFLFRFTSVTRFRNIDNFAFISQMDSAS